MSAFGKSFDEQPGGDEKDYASEHDADDPADFFVFGACCEPLNEAHARSGGDRKHGMTDGEEQEQQEAEHRAVVPAVCGNGHQRDHDGKRAVRSENARKKAGKECAEETACTALGHDRRTGRDDVDHAPHLQRHQNEQHGHHYVHPEFGAFEKAADRGSEKPEYAENDR